MGKTRDLFKKAGDTKVTFHSKMGTIKDKNSKQKRLGKSGKSTQKKYPKKVLKTQITMMEWSLT